MSSPPQDYQRALDVPEGMTSLRELFNANEDKKDAEQAAEMKTYCGPKRWWVLVQPILSCLFRQALKHCTLPQALFHAPPHRGVE